jgi:adenylate cyclase class IV
VSRNIEIKARIDNVQGLTAMAASFADEGPIDLVQDDTFFRCATGRLKLRAFPNGTGELIYYRRPDQYGPKESFYLRSPTSAPDSVRESLSLAYGEVGREAHELMDRFGIKPQQLIDDAYVDLLARRRALVSSEGVESNSRK